jgi:catechol 2,3-dioxygenase-like lactoylglutathione lyase family enzyme
MKFICPLITVKDIDVSRKFYEDLLGQKVIRLYDPDAYIIEVGESMEHVCYRLSREGMSDMEIMESTMMPKAFVKAARDKY